MENATKALLIAAAILIAIVLISIGVYVLNMGRSAVNNVDMSEQEIMAFNSKFTPYEGGRVRGAQLNALGQAVVQSNLSQGDDNGNLIKITTGTIDDKTSEAVSSRTDAKTATTAWTKVPTGATYKVKIQYYQGIVDTIIYQANS